VSAYPCPFENVNLSKIEFLKKINCNDAGFSDHSIGIEASILSLSYNPSYIEKHFTIDNNLPGRDNKFAILPNELKRLKEYIEISNKIKINHGNDLQDSEQEVRKVYTGRWG
jgi:sialic acid synthase SpsE